MKTIFETKKKEISTNFIYSNSLKENSENKGMLSTFRLVKFSHLVVDTMCVDSREVTVIHFMEDERNCVFQNKIIEEINHFILNYGLQQ